MPDNESPPTWKRCPSCECSFSGDGDLCRACYYQKYPSYTPGRS